MRLLVQKIYYPIVSLLRNQLLLFYVILRLHIIFLQKKKLNSKSIKKDFLIMQTPLKTVVLAILIEKLVIILMLNLVIM